MPVRSFDLVGLLEDAYAHVEASPAAFLELVLARLGAGIDQGEGASAYFVDASQPDRFDISTFLKTANMVGDAGFSEWNANVPVSFKRRIHLFAPFGTGSTLPRDTFPDGDVVASYETHRNFDMIGVNCLDATGRGCAVAASSARAEPLPDAALFDLYARASVHVATAARLMRRLGGNPVAGAGEAVLQPDGKLVHAQGPARDALAREGLKRAVVQIDRLRTREGRSDPGLAAKAWKALVAKRWSLVEEFEQDGRRYLIAVPNAPEPHDTTGLTARENAVAHAVAMGHANKLIAYELGLSESSIATYVARACKKLGVESRVGLIAAMSRREP